MQPQTFIQSLVSVFADPDLCEILLNGSSCAEYLYRLPRGRELRPGPFQSAEELTRCMQELARSLGLRLDLLQPANGGEWQDRSQGLYLRWHCVLAPIAPQGPLVSVRRHRFVDLGLEDFGFSAEQRRQLDSWMNSQSSLLVAGATGAGKSTLLHAIINHYCADERVLILEQVAELPTDSHPRWARMVARGPNFEGHGEFSLSRALEETLRLRPDRIVVGEVRGPEIQALLQAALCGHNGVMATIHAESLEGLHTRLSSLLPAAFRDLAVEVLSAFSAIVIARGSPPKIVNMGRLLPLNH